MAKKRKQAQGKPCMVRLPGCDGGGETTILAHYRMAGYCGVGMKPDDDMATWCCWPCHDRIDGRVKLPGWTREEIRLAHAEGCLRTAVERKRLEAA